MYEFTADCAQLNIIKHVYISVRCKWVFLHKHPSIIYILVVYCIFQGVFKVVNEQGKEYLLQAPTEEERCLDTRDICRHPGTCVVREARHAAGEQASLLSGQSKVSRT